MIRQVLEVGVNQTANIAAAVERQQQAANEWQAQRQEEEAKAVQNGNGGRRKYKPTEQEKDKLKRLTEELELARLLDTQYAERQAELERQRQAKQAKRELQRQADAEEEEEIARYNREAAKNRVQPLPHNHH